MSMDQPAGQLRRWNGMIGRLEQLGHARDGLLVAIAIDYLLGFLSWSIYSLKENLGFVHILDSQYLFGGILPALSIVAVAVGWWMWRVLSEYIRTLAALFIYLLYFTIPLVTIYLIAGGHIPQAGVSFYSALSETAKASLLFVTGLLLTPLLLIGLREARATTWTIQSLPRFLRRPGIRSFVDHLSSYRILVILFGYYFLFVIIVGMMGLYFAVIYPSLPQELGGPRARCADVVFEARQLPQELKRDAGISQVDRPPPASAPDTEAAATAKAQILYNDDKVVIFKPRGSADAPLIEIRKDLVKALVWCRQ